MIEERVCNTISANNIKHLILNHVLDWFSEFTKSIEWLHLYIASQPWIRYMEDDEFASLFSSTTLCFMQRLIMQYLS